MRCGLWLLGALLFAIPANAETPVEDDPFPSEDAQNTKAATRATSLLVWPTKVVVPLTKALDDEEVVEWRIRSQELDATLKEAAPDLGFELELESDKAPESDLALLEVAIARARSKSARGWMVRPTLERLDSRTYLLRLALATPGSKELRVRLAKVSGRDVSAKGLVLLRDLLAFSSPIAVVNTQRAATTNEQLAPSESPKERSSGRAILATSGAVYGAFAAYSLQRASGSDDPRILYPLLALGTGAGLGASLLAASEWDVSTGDAWMVTAGLGWGTLSGLSMAAYADPTPVRDRYVWGLGGGLAGLGIATFAITRTKMDEGDAVLTHSGAAWGSVFGTMGEYLRYGSLEISPSIGLGIGTAIGFTSGAAWSIFAKTDPSRVLIVDLGAGLGAFGGAALSSPLLFDKLSTTKTRLFVAGTALGAVTGGLLSYFLTKPSSRIANHFMPGAGVVAVSQTPRGEIPAYGLTLSYR